MRDVFGYGRKAREVWRAARASGLSVKQALESMKGYDFGVGLVIDTIVSEEDMPLSEVARLIEQQGESDYAEY